MNYQTNLETVAQIDAINKEINESIKPVTNAIDASISDKLKGFEREKFLIIKIAELDLEY